MTSARILHCNAVNKAGIGDQISMDGVARHGRAKAKKTIDENAWSRRRQLRINQNEYHAYEPSLAQRICIFMLTIFSSPS